jgi:glyoxylase I family protein
VIAGVHHTDLVVTSLEESLPFYQELLGWAESGEIVGEQGERVMYIWPPGRPPYWRGSIGLREKRSDAHGVPFDRYAVGFHHIAFFVDSRADVDERGEWLRARNVKIESGPKEYDYMPGYYAVFFYDPDGMKLEILHHSPSEEG